MNTPSVPPTIGRIIIVTLPDHAGVLVRRPAIIVRTWPDGGGGIASFVNAQVFMDGDGTERLNDGLPNVLWKTSITYDPTQQLALSWAWPLMPAGPAVTTSQR